MSRQYAWHTHVLTEYFVPALTHAYMHTNGHSHLRFPHCSEICPDVDSSESQLQHQPLSQLRDWNFCLFQYSALLKLRSHPTLVLVWLTPVHPCHSHEKGFSRLPDPACASPLPEIQLPCCHSSIELRTSPQLPVQILSVANRCYLLVHHHSLRASSVALHLEQAACLSACNASCRQKRGVLVLTKTNTPAPWLLSLLLQ